MIFLFVVLFHNAYLLYELFKSVMKGWNIITKDFCERYKKKWISIRFDFIEASSVFYLRRLLIVIYVPLIVPPTYQPKLFVSDHITCTIFKLWMCINLSILIKLLFWKWDTYYYNPYTIYYSTVFFILFHFSLCQ